MNSNAEASDPADLSAIVLDEGGRRSFSNTNMVETAKIWIALGVPFDHEEAVLLSGMAEARISPDQVTLIG